MEAIDRQLDRARRGEPEALSAIYRRFLPGVFGYIAARVPDRATAEDLTSDVFVQMVERISRLRASDEASVAAWILQIARVTVAGYYRKREHQPAFVSLEPRLGLLSGITRLAPDSSSSHNLGSSETNAG